MYYLLLPFSQSDTVVDLPHHRCNRVYVPWVSGGTSSFPTIPLYTPFTIDLQLDLL